NARIETQLATPIRVIVGNPPYSAGQTSANDNNANLKYPTLDARIVGTYAARSTSTNKNSLYDSYIRAFRWATDRLGEQGVLAFVSNNGWVDGNTADGIRRSFADDFSDVYLYNLRGNARTAGILRRQEGGGIFDSGARTGVAVLIAVKNPARTGTARIHYHGVPDYQTREEKLSDLDEACLSTVGWRTITPNEDGDWLNQRDESFATFPAIGIKDVKDPSLRHFTLHSRGIATSRDAWCYNFSADKVEHNMRRMLDTYNAETAAGHTKAEQLDNNPTRISWSRGLVADALCGRHHQYRSERRYPAATYRPFTKQSVYFDRPLNDMVYRLESIFPTPHHTNLGYYIVDLVKRVTRVSVETVNIVRSLPELPI
ncbi:type ISP restriction/modification enzyme, partial [Cutibacterium avidum]